MNKIANVLIVSTSLKTQGGISSVINQLFKTDLADNFNLFHIETHINKNIFIKLFFLIKSYIYYPFILKQYKIDIIHVHGAMKSSFFRKSYFLVIGKIFKKHVIYHMHSAKIDQFMNRSSSIKKFLIRELLNQYDLIIAISKYWQDVLAQYTDTKICVVYNPISLPDRLPLKPKCSQFTILTLGELGPRKGTESIIQIATLLKDEDVVFVVGGNGDIAHYQAMAAAAGIDDKVVFRGWVDGAEKEGLLSTAHAYLLPSLFEGLPMSIIEAMAYGLPIIATKTGGVPEIVIDAHNGFIHDPDDVEGMKNSILRLKENTELRNVFGANSRQIVQSKLEKEVIAKKIDTIYRDLYFCRIN